MARERENLPVEVRPYRVGLTLSGGGAKGFAHVGALKAIGDSAGYNIRYERRSCYRGTLCRRLFTR